MRILEKRGDERRREDWGRERKRQEERRREAKRGGDRREGGDLDLEKRGECRVKSKEVMMIY